MEKLFQQSVGHRIDDKNGIWTIKTFTDKDDKLILNVARLNGKDMLQKYVGDHEDVYKLAENHISKF